MLTLERMGIRTVALYAAAAQSGRAPHGARRDSWIHGARAVSGIARPPHAIGRRSHDRHADSASDSCAISFAVKLNDDGRYDGAMAAWLGSELRPVLPAGAIDDDALLKAAAGAPSTGPEYRVEWEGQRYTVDPGGAELQRLRRARVRQEEARFDTVLGLAALAQTLTRQPLTAGRRSRRRDEVDGGGDRTGCG